MQVGTGAVLLLAVRPAALPHVCLAHVDPYRFVRDPVHGRVRVDPADGLGCQSFFLNWVQRTVDVAVPQLHQHWPELNLEAESENHECGAIIMAL